MGDLQNTICQLLTELKEIFEENNISYFLGGFTALNAQCQEEFDENIKDGSMLVFVQDARKVISAIEQKNRQNRVLEYLEKNKDFPGFFLKYSAEDTTYFEKNFYRGYQTYGISVNIFFICCCPEDNVQKKKYGLIEKGLFGRNGYKIYKQPGEIKWNKALKEGLENHDIEELFETLIRAYSEPSEEVFYHSYIRPKITFRGKRKIFDTVQKRKLNGNVYAVPGDIEGFFKGTFQRPYQEVFALPRRTPALVIDSELPYNMFFREMDLTPKQFLLQNEKNNMDQLAVHEECKEAKEYIDETWAKVKAIEKRLSLQKIYDSTCLEEIRQAWDGGDYEEVYRILRPWQEFNCYCRDNNLKKEEYIVNEKLERMVEGFGIGMYL
ncbi:MAG: hypothetical protein LUF92_11040 [Clostridiales bacterium]|nr:hypothetical protein [Clostridiales bacterium]